MSYPHELLSIKARHYHCRQAWEPHPERTKNVVRAAIRKCPTRRKAVIFASGTLYHVTVPGLAAAFAQVVLVHVIHRPGAGWRQANFTALADDVTGVAESEFSVCSAAAPLLPCSQSCRNPFPSPAALPGRCENDPHPKNPLPD
jgi:hypothetical protein